MGFTAKNQPGSPPGAKQGQNTRQIVITMKDEHVVFTGSQHREDLRIEEPRGTDPRFDGPVGKEPGPIVIKQRNIVTNDLSELRVEGRADSVGVAEQSCEVDIPPPT